MSGAKVSVIIPVYNTELYLNKCLDSVINQTLKEIEIICINDGSLSVYCGLKGIPYANVEAEDGHVEEQISLIAEVVSVIEELALRN